LFSKEVYYIRFPPAVYKGSFFLASSPTFVDGGVLDAINQEHKTIPYSKRGEVET
jgi:hypothetical protein